MSTEAAKKNSQQVQTASRQTLLLPPVDIVEESNQIQIIADLPGISKDGLNVRVDGNTLMIEGDVKLDIPDQLESSYAEIRSGAYQRSFTLSRELDTEKINADLKEGVLTLTIPKREEAKPLRIEVKVA